MQDRWETRHHPVYPPGVNSVETRVRLLEQRAFYEDKAKQVLEARIDYLEQERERDRDDQEQMLRSIGIKVIAMLLTAISGLAIVVIKLLFPSLFGHGV